MTKHLQTFKFNLIGGKALYNRDLPTIDYLVDDFIIKGGLTYIVGPPASFKTGLMLLTSINGACRNKLLNFKIKKPFTTLFIDEENGIRNTKDRFVKLVDGVGIDVDNDLGDTNIVFANISNFKFVKNHIDMLELVVKQLKPDLIVIDNIARCLKGDERNEQDVSEILNLIKPLIETYGVSFVIIHHCRKGNGTTLEDISGSRDFGGQCDNAFLLKQCGKKDKVKKFVVSQVKSKYGLEMDAINFTVESSDTDDLLVKYVGTAVENIQNVVDAIKQELMLWIPENHSKIYKTTELINAMKEKGYKKTSIRSAIELIVDDKILEHGRKGEYVFCG